MSETVEAKRFREKNLSSNHGGSPGSGGLPGAWDGHSHMRVQSPKGSPESPSISLGGPSAAPPAWDLLDVFAGCLLLLLACSQEFPRRFSTQKRGLPVSLTLHICAA